ncbi:MAG: hypothetical protein MJE68_10010, partial [Proteobacteria bacterium]|nr:hypothetical protein [Pseudomonadota bacterium]
MNLRNKKQSFDEAIWPKGGRKKKPSTPKNTDDDDSQTVSEADKQEERRQQCLAKQESIHQAWAKRKNIIFKGLGKMTHLAYEVALKDINFESKFQKKGKQTEV